MPLGRRRRPLLRAAAVGGGAYMAGKHAARSEEPAYDEPGPEPEPEAAAETAAGAGLDSDAMARLQQLGQLHEQGVLTDEEFAAQKAALLGG